MSADSVHHEVGDTIIHENLEGEIIVKALDERSEFDAGGRTVLVVKLDDGSTRTFRASQVINLKADARYKLQELKRALEEATNALEQADISELDSYPAYLPSLEDFGADLNLVKIP